jgi:tRNA A-37 threonylcarbamoyl transferase component Bud32
VNTHPRTDLPPGTRLGPYTLADKLGQGATATVYLATDAQGRPFAVKVRRRGQSEMDRRFLREFESMRLLRVPGVVTVHEAGIEDEYLWFSMDRVFGKPFHAALHDEPYLIARVERAIEVGAKLLGILADLHEAGYTHRDVKPSNVLVDQGGDVHVLDFGIGRYFQQGDTLSHSGEVLGTIPFMSPEQLAGLPSGEQVDLFATGIMLHEAVAGKRPRPLTTVGWIPKICLERLPALATLYREVPRGFSELVERLLAVDPVDRPSAREAATALKRVASGAKSQEWPTPVHEEPGDWWLPLEGCIGHGPHPPVWVVEGPVGSGKRRVAEHLHRMALLEGTWTLHLRCRIDRVGAPMLQLVERLLADLDDEAIEEVLGPAAHTLRQLWAHLPLPVDRGDSGQSTGHVIEELAQIVLRLARVRSVLVVVHDVQWVDRFSARLLPLIAAKATRGLGLLVLHESRWATAASTALVSTLRREADAGVVSVPRLPLEVCRAIGASLCPAQPPTFDRPLPAHRAVEAGWKALAAWRNEPFPRPEVSLWPASVYDEPIPAGLYQKLVGADPATVPWLAVEGGSVTLSGPTARMLATSRLPALQRSAAMLANGYRKAEGAHPGALATLHLLAGDTNRAWEPAAHAAILADRYGEFAVARQWLLLLDTLPPSPTRSASLDFEIAWVQCRVALRTDPSGVRLELVDAAEALARTEAEHQRVRLLRAEFGLRQGAVRPPLVAALRVGSPNSGAPPHLMVRALLVAIRCRLMLGQIPEALRDLDRAEALVVAHPDPLLQVRITAARADLAYSQHDLAWCRALCLKNIRVASEHGYVRGVAFAAHRLGQVLRVLGRRREAEAQVRSARDGFVSTGDTTPDAEAGLSLATLLVERGEPLAARHLLDETIHRIRGLYLDHLLPRAMRVTLKVATLTGETTDATLALPGVDTEADDEASAALVHWWRSRGDVDRALSVVPPRDDKTYGHALWRLERARAAVMGNRDEIAREEARRGLEEANAQGFAELQVYGELLLGATTAVDDEAWAELQRRAMTSMWTEVFLGALEMDARRLSRTQPEVARQRWRALQARAGELGYRPGVEEATGWLSEPS